MKINLELLRNIIENLKLLSLDENLEVCSYLNLFMPYIIANENISYKHEGIEYNIDSVESFMDFAQHALKVPLK